MPDKKLKRSYKLTKKEIDYIKRRNKINKIKLKLKKLLFKNDKS
tara:strand:- start:2705 stop:2836 length:132 start_codon:yes stop_codon:yes gene_type:complete